MSEESEDYRRGLIEGRLSALEDRYTKTEGRVDNHEQRLSAQERVMWGVLGAFIFMQVWPTIKAVLAS